MAELTERQRYLDRRLNPGNSPVRTARVRFINRAGLTGRNSYHYKVPRNLQMLGVGSEVLVPSALDRGYALAVVEAVDTKYREATEWIVAGVSSPQLLDYIQLERDAAKLQDNRKRIEELRESIRLTEISAKSLRAIRADLCQELGGLIVSDPNPSNRRVIDLKDLVNQAEVRLGYLDRILRANRNRLAKLEAELS